MAAASMHQLIAAPGGISCHAWNADRTELAMSPNSNELVIYENCQAPMSQWKEKVRLSEHDLLISGIDWHPQTNMIVTCAHDRNAFVWTCTDDVWTPSLVILRIEFAAIDCKWSPDGRKFAVASGAKCVPVCYYERENSWWVSKLIKKPHKSTVLCVAWHPNSQMLATGSSDFKCRLFSAFIPEDEAAQDMGPVPYAEPKVFADLYFDFPASGWVHCVDWSKSGNVLAFASHDSSIHFVQFDRPENGVPVQQTIKLPFLPLSTIKFINDTALLAGGHDCNPVIFWGSGGAWAMGEFVDKKSAVTEEKAAPTSGAAAARAMFQSKTKTGQTKSKGADASISWQKHACPITCMQPCAPNQAKGVDNLTQFSTSGLDGRITKWDLASADIAHSKYGI